MGELGILGIIHLAIVVYALIRIFDSRESTGSKLLWTLIVAAFPLFGVIIWYLIGPGSPKR